MTGKKQLIVAFPVFNGAAQLEEALATVLTEKSIDLNAVIYDNASTDDTAEIAAFWAKQDARVKVVRRSQNIGALANFADAAVRAESPYFAWRAHDDLSSPGYLEILADALSRNSNAILAIGATRNVKPNKSDKIIPVPQGPLSLVDAISMAHPGWLYGVWRTPYAQAAVGWTSKNARTLWGWDHLALLHASLNGSFVGCPEATFIRRIEKGPQKAKAGASAAEREKVRSDILSLGQQLISADERDGRELVMDLWDGLVERRVARRSLSSLGKLIAKLKAVGTRRW